MPTRSSSTGRYNCQHAGRMSPCGNPGRLVVTARSSTGTKSTSYPDARGPAAAIPRSVRQTGSQRSTRYPGTTDWTCIAPAVTSSGLPIRWRKASCGTRPAICEPVPAWPAGRPRLAALGAGSMLLIREASEPGVHVREPGWSSGRLDDHSGCSRRPSAWLARLDARCRPDRRLGDPLRMRAERCLALTG